MKGMQYKDNHPLISGLMLLNVLIQYSVLLLPHFASSRSYKNSHRPVPGTVVTKQGDPLKGK